jgi:hypothetical protein
MNLPDMLLFIYNKNKKNLLYIRVAHQFTYVSMNNEDQNSKIKLTYEKDTEALFSMIFLSFIVSR